MMRAAMTWIIILYFTVAYGQEVETAGTIEERLERLERSLVTLRTQFEARTTVGAGALGSSQRGLSAQADIDRLSRELTSLSSEVLRLQREVDAAQREAAEARRVARDAQMNARNALSRVR